MTNTVLRTSSSSLCEMFLSAVVTEHYIPLKAKNVSGLPGTRNDAKCQAPIYGSISSHEVLESMLIADKLSN